MPGRCRGRHPRLSGLALVGSLWAVPVASGFAQVPTANGGPFTEGRAAFDRHELERALPLFRQAAATSPRAAERHAWLAETARRLGDFAEAVRSAETALALDQCLGLAHAVLADTYNPQQSHWDGAAPDSVWPHLRMAADCEPADGNVGFAMWVEAQRRQDPHEERAALQRLVRTGMLTSATLSYGRWLLRLAPSRAVVITGGDLDTYPAAAVQALEGLRPDVAIVNAPLLELSWYVRHIARRHNLPLPLPVDSLAGDSAIVDLRAVTLRAWRMHVVAGTLGRPLTFALTAGAQPQSPELGALLTEGAATRAVATEAQGGLDLEGLAAATALADSLAWKGPGVSPADRSPVRRTYSAHPARVPLYLAVALGMSAVDDGDRRGAEAQLVWGRQFGAGAGIPPAEIEGSLDMLAKALDHR